MDDTIYRQAAIDAVIKHLQLDYEYAWGVREAINGLPSADFDKLFIPQSVEIDERLAKIADLVEGTIDHFDRDDAMDVLYQIKGVLRGEQE